MKKSILLFFLKVKNCLYIQATAFFTIIFLSVSTFSFAQTYSPSNAYVEDFTVGGRIIEFGANNTGAYSTMFSSGSPFYQSGGCAPTSVSYSCGSGNNRIQSATIMINNITHVIAATDLKWKPCPGEFAYLVPNNIYIQDGDSVRFTVVLCGTASNNGGYTHFQTPYKKATTINHNFNPTYDPCTKQATFNFTYQDRVIAWKYGSSGANQIGLTHNGSGLPINCFENNTTLGSKRPASSSVNYSNPTILSLVNGYVAQGTESAISTLLATSGEVTILPTSVNAADISYGYLKFFLDGSRLKFWDNLSGLYSEAEFGTVPSGPGNQTWTSSDQLRIKSTNAAYELWKNSNLLYSVSKLVTFSTNAPGATMTPSNQVLPGQTINFNFSATPSGTYDVFIQMGTVRLKQSIVIYTNITPLPNVAVCRNSQQTIPDPDGPQSGVWSSSNNAVATINSSGVLTGVSAGTATITYTQNGSSCQSAFTVTVNELPVVNLNGSDKLCLGENRTVTATPAPGTWSSSNTEVATVNASGVIVPVDYGNTTIMYTHTATGCMNDTSLTKIGVHGFKSPLLTEPSSPVICNPSTQLNYSVTATVSPQGTLSYTWIDPSNNVFDTDANAIVSTGGNYAVILYDGLACYDTLSFAVSNFDASIFGITGTSEACTDSTNAVVSASGGSSYLWMPSNQTSATLSGVGPGTYNVAITDGATGCVDTLSFTIAVYEDNHSAPIASDDIILLLGGNISGTVNVVSNDVTSSNYGLSIVSQGVHGTGVLNGNNMTYTMPSVPLNSTTDVVTYQIFDATCPALFSQADVTITYNIIPEFVSPWTVDGKNDTWDIHLEPSDNIKVTIMNRWGDVFFETTNYQNDWSGQSNKGLVLGGGEATPGTYFYVIRIEDKDETIKGALELVK